MRQFEGQFRSVPAPGLPLKSTRSRRHRSLKESLSAVGAAPPIAKARSLLLRWFRKESLLMTVLNTGFSLFLLALALTMTLIGMKAAQALGIVVTLNEIANQISPYAGIALLGLGTVRLIQNWLMRDPRAIVRWLGYVEVLVLLMGGAWAEGVAWYTGAIPGMLKPPLELAGGAVTAYVLFFSVVVIPFFKPVIAGTLGFLLTAKHLRTSAITGPKSGTQWFLALLGLIASATTLMIGIDAGQQHFGGKPILHDFAMNANTDVLADFSPPFAAGTMCRVSDMFGPRVNPFWGKPKAAAADGDTATPVAAPAKATPVRYVSHIENHPGVDIAAREGTPVLAMADGRVVFANPDPGFGNMVAYQVRAADNAILLMGHMVQLNVLAGQDVKRGDVLGWVGSTGISTGPHLHVQVCPGGHLHNGAFVCGQPRNPYEVWPTLYAIARQSCASGPVGL